jgi:hypothetical protein
LNSTDAGTALDLSQNELVQTFATTDAIAEMLGYRIEVVSTKGNMLTNEIRETVVRARIYRGGSLITYLIPEANFRWKRTSTDTAGDEVWNADPAHIGVKSFTLTANDIKYIGSIHCEITIPD